MFLFFPPVMCNYAIGSECKIKSIVQREMCVCNAGVVPMDTGLQRGLVFFFNHGTACFLIFTTSVQHAHSMNTCTCDARAS